MEFHGVPQNILYEFPPAVVTSMSRVGWSQKFILSQSRKLELLMHVVS